jgi:hypothetical protein
VCRDAFIRYAVRCLGWMDTSDLPPSEKNYLVQHLGKN